LGNGSYGQVYSAKHKDSNEAYALKVLNKKKLINKKQLKYAVGEANILKKMDFPFIINLHFAFQTPLNLYMALDNCPNGDLSELIVVKERLS
jgi:serine/threonine protein kinase